VYAVPAVNPLTVTGEEAPVPVKPPGLEVTVYEVMAALPVSVGAVNVTLAEELLATVAVPMVGAPGEIGQRLCFLQPACSLSVHTPLADVAVGVVGDLVMKPPGYCALMIYSPAPDSFMMSQILSSSFQ
jgi:hypothetical protein